MASRAQIALIFFLAAFGRCNFVYSADAPKPPPKWSACMYTDIRYAADFFFQQDQIALATNDIRRIAPILDPSKRSHLFRGWELIVVVGHADPIEHDAMALSIRRAAMVKQLFEQFNVPPSVISTQGAGSKQPLGSNSSVNRRVEVELIGKCGEPQ